MLARKPNITRTTNIFAGHMIARFVAIHNIRTLFLASVTVVSLGTWFATRVAYPTATANAFARFRVA